MGLFSTSPAMRQHKLSFLQVVKTVIRLKRRTHEDDLEEVIKPNLSRSSPSLFMKENFHSNRENDQWNQISHKSHLNQRSFSKDKNRNFKPKYHSQKIRSNCEKQIDSKKIQDSRKIENSRNSSTMDNSSDPEKVSRRKMSLKAVYQGGRTLVRGRHHQSCPDLSMEMEMVELVDCLDRNTCHLFWDNPDLDIGTSDLIEIYLE
eukprot:TRINITY_DN5252_c0_g1_i1.p1 TRINITY_DN5252_c0_g1~~TRINITY_DN5252_c0_g1_i1.p1  ORF type:complete len:212 (-),score=49.33 TRINITY_DN5252_c0_g1_i1:11-622(-)